MFGINYNEFKGLGIAVWLGLRGGKKLFPSLILSHHRFYGKSCIVVLSPHALRSPLISIHSHSPLPFVLLITFLASLRVRGQTREKRDGKSVNYSLLYEKWQEINVSMIIIILYSALRLPSQIVWTFCLSLHARLNAGKICASFTRQIAFARWNARRSEHKQKASFKYQKAYKLISSSRKRNFSLVSEALFCELKINKQASRFISLSRSVAYLAGLFVEWGTQENFRAHGSKWKGNRIRNYLRS